MKRTRLKKTATNNEADQLSTLDNGSIGDGGVLDDDCDAIFDDPSLVFPIGFLDSILVDDLDVAANACVLVDYAPPHNSVGTCVSLRWSRQALRSARFLKVELTCTHV